MTLAVNIAQSGSNNVTFRNRIINGGMVIDQRNAGASVTPTDQQYCVDRWQARLSQASKYTVQQNAGSVTPPAGFKYYFGVTSSSAYTVLTGDYFAIEQNIEGYNYSDFAWGTASATATTLSFWVRSSLTGTFGGGIRNGTGSQYTYPFSYTISSANTWEQKTVSIAAPTSTWNSNTTNGLGVIVTFGLGVGATYSGTAGAWTSSVNALSATGATSVVGTSSATFYITGVQLEAGSTASPFEYRQYGTELALCQRYYYSSGTGNQAYTVMGNGWEYSSTFAQVYCPLPIPMRVTPTSVSYSTLQTNNSAAANPSVSSLSLATTECSTIAGKVNVTISGGNAGAVCMLRAANSTSGYIAFNAEL